MVECPGRSRDSTGQIEVEQEILAEALARGDPVSRENFAQRRQRRPQGIG
jgi:hypothetical protein